MLRTSTDFLAVEPDFGAANDAPRGVGRHVEREGAAVEHADPTETQNQERDDDDADGRDESDG